MTVHGFILTPVDRDPADIEIAIMNNLREGVYGLPGSTSSVGSWERPPAINVKTDLTLLNAYDNANYFTGTFPVLFC